MEEQNSCCGHEGKGKCLCVKHIVMAVLALALIVYVGALTRNALRNYDYIGKSPDYKNIVSVDGVGKVTVKPDVAVLNLGIVTEGASVATIQKQNTDKMNAIIKALKDQFRIEEKDIQTTNYNINPKYDWSDRVQRIVGYTINQSVTIKVRNFDQIGDVLAKAGELGANTVNGPQFTIDDPEVYKVQAREKAIAQAKDKANVLADQVGIKLGRIIGFSEGSSGYPVPMYDKAYGMGGATEALSSVAPSPVIAAGSEEVQINVSISYEIK